QIITGWCVRAGGCGGVRCGGTVCWFSLRGDNENSGGMKEGEEEEECYLLLTLHLLTCVHKLCVCVCVSGCVSVCVCVCVIQMAIWLSVFFSILKDHTER